MGGDGLAVNDGLSFPFDRLKLEEEKSIESSFSVRPPNWNSIEGFSFWQAKILGNMSSMNAYGVNLYSNFAGRQIGLGENSPTFIGNTQEYQMFLSAFYRLEVLSRLSMAVTGKYYSASNNFITVVFGSSTSGRQDGSALMADFSAMYEIPVNGEEQSIFFGSSISNLGTDVVYANDLTYKLPRSFIVEAAYLLRSPSSTVSRIEFICDYRNVVNSKNADNHIFWRSGAEISLYNALFLRTGMYIAPYSTIFGLKGKPVFSYGAGISFSGEKIRIPKSRFTVDLGLLPIDRENFQQHQITGVGTNYAISLTFTTY
ncbi:MAG: hypothetical protein WCT99_01315 [Bacteroidota bacterium]